MRPFCTDEHSEVRWSLYIFFRFNITGHVQIIQSGDTNVLWDGDEVLDVLHRYNCVVAAICGHDHDGNYTIDDHGIHHITMPGIIETSPDDQAYGTVHIYEDKMELVGVGSIVPNLTIPFSTDRSNGGIR